MGTNRTRCTSRGALALLGIAALLLVAGPAQAKDEFEDGFKDELGRIAAHEAVYAGKHILGAILLPGGHGHPGTYGTYGRGYGHHHGHVSHVPPGHRKHYKRHKHHRHYAGYGSYGYYGYAPYAGHGHVVHHEHHHYYHGEPCGSGYHHHD